MAIKQKKHLNCWQIWNMSFGFLGIQFGFALQNANVSRIFETLGANIEDIPILWIAAPVTGLLIQPIIGHMSDNTWGKLGRRRPYFLFGAIFASLALLIMPNSPTLWVAAGMLWIMDASINISMEPFRAFVGDMLPSDQRTKGFAMQSFFIGTGAVVASSLPYILTNWFGVETVSADGGIPDSVKWSFYIGAAIFISAIVWTVSKSKEYSPEELAEFNKAETSEQESIESIGKSIFNKVGLISILIGLSTTFFVIYMDYAKELFILSLGLVVFGITEFFAGFLFKKKIENGFVEVMSDFNAMPKTMVQLAFVQFFSWFALFAMWIYTTSGVTSHIYDMNADAELINQIEQAVTQNDSKDALEIKNDIASFKKELETKSEVTLSMKFVNYFLSNNNNLNEATISKIKNIDKQYNLGANWVGVCFSIYNGAAAVFAFLLMFMARVTNRKITHSISLMVGGISLASIYFVGNPDLLLVPFIGIGLAWASILAMPYAILTGSLPSNKMGTYMGIFNFFIVIPQILAASLLGFFIKQLFAGEAIYALILGGISMFIAAILVVFVKDDN